MQVEDDPFFERQLPVAGCSEGKSESGSIITSISRAKRASYLERRLVRNAALADRAPWQWRQPERPGPRRPSLQGAAQAEAGFVESALGFPDRAPGPGSERAIVADIDWRSTDLVEEGALAWRGVVEGKDPSEGLVLHYALHKGAHGFAG